LTPAQKAELIALWVTENDPPGVVTLAHIDPLSA
jgi:hypothetical protein